MSQAGQRTTGNLSWLAVMETASCHASSATVKFAAALDAPPGPGLHAENALAERYIAAAPSWIPP